MIKILLFGLVLVTTLAAVPTLAAQEVWNDERLEAEMAPFKDNKTTDDLQTVAHLLKHQKEATHAICNRIHGNHAEYLLRIEKLLDQLTDERWANREKAEDMLVEVGGKARELIRVRSKMAETVEERIRAARALEAIKLRGTEREEIEARYIRGLSLTALYMNPSKKLTKALVSALQHTDPIIVNRCIRALGRIGDDSAAGKLLELLKTDGSTHGSAIRASLASLPGSKGRDYTAAQLAESLLAETESLLMLRILRERSDGAAALATVAKAAKNPVVVTGAKMPMPKSVLPPITVQVSLADQTRIEGTLLGYAGDSIRLGQPKIVKGSEKESIDIAELRFPLNRCDGIDAVGTVAKKTVDACRMFLAQGTLVTGKLEAVTNEKVILMSATFGRMVVRRDQVQGLAIDPKLDRLLGASAKQDKIRFKDNKLHAGSILALDHKGLSYQGEDGKGHTAQLEDIAGLLFKRPLQTAVDNRTFTRTIMKNGDRVLGHVAALTASHIGVVAPGIGSTIIAIKDIVKMEYDMGGGAMWGFTLVADYSDNRIVEFDDQGREVFSIEEIFGVWDVECLDNGNLLITEFSVNRVSEVTRQNKVVWSFEDLKNPYDADRLANGNTLIADTFGRRVIEVNPKGKIVWEYKKDIHPYDVDRLPNGNTLIADTHDDRVIEVDKNGKIVWQIKEVPNVHDADRLPNGNTLLTIRMLNEVREVDPSGKTVMTLKNLSSPSDADRLPNGNTLVAENGFIREFDRHGNEVWKKTITWAVEVNRY